MFCSPKYGSFGQPFSFTPLGLLSIRKCLTSSLAMSPARIDTVNSATVLRPRTREACFCRTLLPFLLWCTEGGGEATFMAKPYAPLNEWLSLITKAPGSLSFSRLMAVNTQHIDIFISSTDHTKNLKN